MAWVAVAAVSIPTAAPSQTTAASPTKGASYGYFPVAGGTEVRLDVSPRGRALEVVDISREVRCSNGREASVDYVWDLSEGQPARVPIRRDGSFSSAFTESDLHPFAISEEYWLSGRFIRRGKAARLVIRIRQVGEGGTICETGDLRITARRF